MAGMAQGSGFAETVLNQGWMDQAGIVALPARSAALAARSRGRAGGGSCFDLVAEQRVEG